jgi:hypothetical protein
LVLGPAPRNRCCNVRAESQPIVRQAYSQAYNTPLRQKVVYNASIFPDGRVVVQDGGGGMRVTALAPEAPSCTAQEVAPYCCTRSFWVRLGKVNIVAVQHGF